MSKSDRPVINHLCATPDLLAETLSGVLRRKLAWTRSPAGVTPLQGAPIFLIGWFAGAAVWARL